MMGTVWFTLRIGTTTKILAASFWYPSSMVLVTEGGREIPREINMRLDIQWQCSPSLLQFHNGRVRLFHHKVGHSPPVYNRHVEYWTGISLHLSLVSVYITVDLGLELSNVGVGFNLDAIIDLYLDVPNGGFQYQKVACNPINIGTGERCAF